MDGQSASQGHQRKIMKDSSDQNFNINEFTNINPPN